MGKLSRDEINSSLEMLPEWRIEENTITKNFVLKDFSKAVSFLVEAGFIAEKEDHHPDLFLYNWNNVKITLSTHSEGGITKKDFDLAHKIEKLLL